MRDIERELRALGERAAAETSEATSVPPNMLRRVRTMRFLTASLAASVLFAIVGGGALATRSLSSVPEVVPAEEPETTVEDLDSQGSTVVLASSLETGRVVLTFDPAAQGVCYGGDLRGLERLDVVTTEGNSDGDTALSLFPADDDFSDYGYLCTRGLPVAVLNRVITSPEDFALLSVTDGVEHFSGLADVQAPPNAQCLSVGFEPTYLPQGWAADLQQGIPDREATSAKHLGFYGPPGRTDEERPASLVDLTAESGPVAPQQDGDLEVLGAETTFVPGDSGHGSNVTFGFEDCTYTLEASGIEDEEFIRFAEGLRQRDDSQARTSDGCGGETPALKLEPAEGPVGTRVRFTGTCFKKNWDAGYGIFFVRQFTEPRECELTASEALEVEVARDGSARGSFIVPERGSCFQQTYDRTLTPGTYEIGVGCHACSAGTTFRVTRGT